MSNLIISMGLVLLTCVVIIFFRAALWPCDAPLSLVSWVLPQRGSVGWAVVTFFSLETLFVLLCRSKGNFSAPLNRLPPRVPRKTQRAERQMAAWFKISPQRLKTAPLSLHGSAGAAGSRCMYICFSLKWSCVWWRWRGTRSRTPTQGWWFWSLRSPHADLCVCLDDRGQQRREGTEDVFSSTGLKLKFWFVRDRYKENSQCLSADVQMSSL